MTRRVDVVIACHTATRPLARAVASVLDGNGDHASVIVVAHGLPADELRKTLPPAQAEQVRWLEHEDGNRSAAGPYNAGMRAGEAELVSLLGSDDQLMPGAVASWLALLDGTTSRLAGSTSQPADCVISRLAAGEGHRPVPTPPVRPWLRPGHPADLVKDRLAYRSAPLGLVRQSTRRELGLELVEGLATGDDVPYVTRLWAETRVLVDRSGPAYVIGEDATDRVTLEPRPIREELAAVTHVLDARWFRGYPTRVREAIATKLLRIHIFGALHYRPDPAWWTAEERTDLATITRDLLLAAPACADPLSLADHDLLEAALDPTVPAARLVEASRARRRHGRPRTLIPKDPRLALHPEAPGAFMAASLAAALAPGVLGARPLRTSRSAS